MGRKPNRLVLEFFDRGAKLPDGSNRYEHTCKACGEFFPKGRIESLMSHVTTKCQAIAPEDRHRARVQLYERPDEELRDTSGSLKPSATSKGQRYTTKLPFTGGRNFTGLEVLAEASRQIEHPRKPGHNRIEENTVIDPSLQSLWECGISAVHTQEGPSAVGTSTVDVNMNSPLHER